MDAIPYSRQDISEDDIAAVTRVLRSDWLTQGPVLPAFEAAFAERHGVAHAVAVSNATAALHLACLALGIGPKSTVISVSSSCGSVSLDSSAAQVPSATALSRASSSTSRSRSVSSASPALAGPAMIRATSASFMPTCRPMREWAAHSYSERHTTPTRMIRSSR